ncbi:extracellular solute-binding protein, partial [candidate division WOR-3 bacterium]|nr:extracellular solute-binding protein [candidate division WOR-3 bacterium]
WPEFRQMAKRFSAPAENRWGCAGLVNEGMFGAMLRQKGGDYFDPTGTRVTFNSPAGVEAAQFISELVNRDSSVYYGSGYEPQNDFLAGTIACIQSTSVSWAFMKPNMRFAVGVAPVPTWQTPNVISFGTNVGMFRTGTPEQVASGWRFIKWFTSPEQQAKWAGLTFYVPVRKSSLRVESYARVLEATPGLAEALAQLDYMSFEPKSEAWFSGRKALGDALEQIVRGGMPAQQALDEAARLVEQESAGRRTGN